MGVCGLGGRGAWCTLQLAWAKGTAAGLIRASQAGPPALREDHGESTRLSALHRPGETASQSAPPSSALGRGVPRGRAPPPVEDAPTPRAAGVTPPPQPGSWEQTRRAPHYKGRNLQGHKARGEVLMPAGLPLAAAPGPNESIPPGHLPAGCQEEWPPLVPCPLPSLVFQLLGARAGCARGPQACRPAGPQLTAAAAGCGKSLEQVLP